MSKSPFVVKEYIALPGDVVMYYAVDEVTGILCAGKQTYDAALQDANALNAARNLGYAEGIEHAMTQLVETHIEWQEKAKAARRAAAIMND